MRKESVRDELEKIVYLLENDTRKCIVLTRSDWIEVHEYFKESGLINTSQTNLSIIDKYIVYSGIRIYMDEKTVFSYSIKESLYIELKKLVSIDYILNPMAIEYFDSHSKNGILATHSVLF